MNIFFLLLWNTVFFVCNLYPKHILEIGSLHAIPAVLFNVLYYFVLYLFLIIAWRKNKTFFSESVFSPVDTFWQKIQIKRIGLLMLIQMGMDLLSLGVLPMTGSLRLYFMDALTVVQWVVVYLLCAKKESSLFRVCKAAVPVSAAFLLFFIVSSAFTYDFLEQSHYFVTKYEWGSEAQLRGSRNLEFMFQMKNYILDTACGITLLAAHGLCNRRTDKDPQVNRWVVASIRAASLLGVSVLVVIAKTMVFPISCLHGFRWYACDTVHHENNDRFDANPFYITFTRVEEDFRDKVALDKSTDEIVYGGKKVREIEVDRTQDLTEEKPIDENATAYIIDRFERRTVCNIPYAVYRNQAICFIDNSKPCVIEFAAIHKQKENQLLITVCEDLLKNEHIEVLDHCYGYLQKYDPDFLVPYTERYRQGHFTEKEKARLQALGIRPSYLADVANG